MLGACVITVFVSVFVGEVGGLMGLMLGASVMTVCEVVDLFIYNGIIKFIYTRKHKNKKITVSPFKK